MSSVGQRATETPGSHVRPSPDIAPGVAIAAGLSAAVAVAAGAFGAHAASGIAADWLKTGAQYQLVHAVAALAITRSERRLAPALLLSGGAIFGGTLYLMAAGLPRWLGAITPIGGVLLIVGWLVVAVDAWRAR